LPTVFFSHPFEDGNFIFAGPKDQQELPHSNATLEGTGLEGIYIGLDRVSYYDAKL
jgi:hypothetical protein